MNLIYLLIYIFLSLDSSITMNDPIDSGAVGLDPSANLSHLTLFPTI